MIQQLLDSGSNYEGSSGEVFQQFTDESFSMGADSVSWTGYALVNDKGEMPDWYEERVTRVLEKVYTGFEVHIAEIDNPHGARLQGETEYDGLVLRAYYEVVVNGNRGLFELWSQGATIISLISASLGWNATDAKKLREALLTNYGSYVKHEIEKRRSR